MEISGSRNKGSKVTFLMPKKRKNKRRVAVGVYLVMLLLSSIGFHSSVAFEWSLPWWAELIISLPLMVALGVLLFFLILFIIVFIGAMFVEAVKAFDAQLTQE